MTAKSLLLLCALVSAWCGAFRINNVKITAAAIHTNSRSHNFHANSYLPLKSESNEGKSSKSGELYNGLIKRFQAQNLMTVWSNVSIRRFITSAVLATSLFLLRIQPSLAASAIDLLPEKVVNSGFVQAFLLIFVSEIGDKTFFIAGLLAAKYSRFISFAGSMGALAVMTILCTILGQIFHAVPSTISQGIPFDDYVAVAAFGYFGLKTLKEAFDLPPGDSSGIEEEKAEAVKTVEEVTIDQKRKSTLTLLAQTFSLVFAAEIGDKSFLSTIALSAAQNPFSVATGAIAAHACATGT